MKEEESNWFSRWEEELPSPDELMPLSQTLITPDLALAFDIPSPPNSISNYGGSHHHHHQTLPLPTLQSQSQSQSQSQQQQSQQVEYDSSDLGGGGGDEQARTLKRPRLVWTPQLHKRFVDAVAHLGIKNAVPKTIMQLMSVDGLTRENVASHLQKYRLYLKRMQGLSSSGGGPGGPVSAADSAMDRLFASAPVPHHFLNRGPTIGPGAEQFTPFASPPGAMQQMMATAAQQQQQYYHHRHIGHLGLPTGSGFDLGYQSRHPRPGFNRTTGPVGIQMAPSPSMGSYAVDLNSGGDGQRVLSLFPANDD